MNFAKKTLFWIGVLVLLAGAFHFFDRRQEGDRLALEAELRLLPFEVRDVTAFWIGNAPEGLRIEARRQQDGWLLTQPLEARGDAKSIEKLLAHIVTARKDALLFAQPTPEKLAELGLDARATQMGLRAAAGETVLVLGERGPTNNVAYVMFQGRPEVYRVHSDLRKEATRDVFALRDKTILDFDPVRMRRLEIARKGAPRVVVEQEQGKWNMLEPARTRASMARTLELLYAVRNAEIKAFVDEKPSALAPYGLASPMLQLTILQEQRETPYVLAIGNKDRARRGYFASTHLRDKVFDVDEELVNAILLNMEQLPEAPAAR